MIAAIQRFDAPGFDLRSILEWTHTISLARCECDHSGGSMQPIERRGMRLFLALAGIIILDKVIGIGFVLFGGLESVNWFHLAESIALVLSLVFLWKGETGLQWMVGVWCIISGVRSLLISAFVIFKLAQITPPEATGFFLTVVCVPIGSIAIFGLFFVGSGLAFLFLPSLGAFFCYQRTRRQFAALERILE